MIIQMADRVKYIRKAAKSTPYSIPRETTVKKSKKGKGIPEQIIDDKFDDTLQERVYLVKWEGKSSKFNTWETEAFLERNALQLFNLYIMPEYFDSDDEVDELSELMKDISINKESLPLMAQLPEEFYSSEINKRRNYETTNAKIDKLVSNFISNVLQKQMLTQKSVSWVGGGRAWTNAKDILINTGDITIDGKESILEQVSFVRGNWDIFQLTDMTQQEQEHNACKILELVTRFIKEVPGLTLGVVRGIKQKKNICTIDKQTICTIFSCRSISVFLGEYTIDKNPLMYIEIANVHRKNSSDYVPFDFFNMKLNLLVFNNSDNITYLNLLGCFLFSRFLDTDRKEKGVNVDRYRRDFIKTIGKYDELLHQSLQVYFELFSQTTQYNKYITPSMKLEIYERMNVVNSVIDSVEITIMNYIRPYANAIISDINKFIRENNYNGYIFISGGDAVRRYVEDVETKDIDTKLYIHDSSEQRKQYRLQFQRELLGLLAKYTIYLNQIKRQIFSNMRYYPNAGTDEVYTDWIDVNNSNLQFTTRLIKEDGSGRPIIISVDYKYKLTVGDTFMLKTLPIIDIALYFKKSLPEVLPYIDTGNGVYSSSIDFLIKDIQHVYNTRELAESRKWSGKVGKDSSRYDKLLVARRFNIQPNITLSTITQLPEVLPDASEYTEILVHDLNKRNVDKINPKVVFDNNQKVILKINEDEESGYLPPTNYIESNNKRVRLDTVTKEVKYIPINEDLIDEFIGKRKMEKINYKE
jgi:hypothetical protein